MTINKVDVSALAEILREAAAIIAEIHPEFPPRNMRWTIVDELEGFALMLADTPSAFRAGRRTSGDGSRYGIR